MSHGHHGNHGHHGGKAAHEHTHATKANVRTFFDEKDTRVATFLVWCPITRRAAVIDPVLDFDLPSATISHTQADQVIAFIKQHQLHVDYILETHTHDDHITAAQYLKKKLDCHSKIGISEHVAKVQDSFKQQFNLPEDYATERDFDLLFKDGEAFEIGNLKVKALHTPGRTPDSTSYYIEDDSIFVGDLLLMPDQGVARGDFPGSNAEQLFNSIQKVLHLPSSVHIFVGHDFQVASREFKWQTSVSDQKSHNVFLREHSTVSKFVDAKNKRDSAAPLPRMFFVSAQINIRAGKLPEPEENGVSYFKVPLLANA